MVTCNKFVEMIAKPDRPCVTSEPELWPVSAVWNRSEDGSAGGWMWRLRPCDRFTVEAWTPPRNAWISPAITPWSIGELLLMAKGCKLLTILCRAYLNSTLKASVACVCLCVCVGWSVGGVKREIRTGDIVDTAITAWIRKCFTGVVCEASRCSGSII